MLQLDDFYPFGLVSQSYQRENSVENKYLYNGKEIQDELQLGAYDFGARMYSPDLGRFFQVDPKSEELEALNSYNYAMNNPLLFVEKNGEHPVFFALYFVVEGATIYLQQGLFILTQIVLLIRLI
ncbi:MAG: RHS repeat domain-containing protein [Bacteroidota bacterium]